MKNELRFKTELIDRAIESAKGRIYRIKEDTSPNCSYIHWIKACNQIELQEITVEALEKMKPKKPIDAWESITHSLNGKCPSCHVLLYECNYPLYCGFCGQRIDWRR